MLKAGDGNRDLRPRLGIETRKPLFEWAIPIREEVVADFMHEKWVTYTLPTINIISPKFQCSSGPLVAIKGAERDRLSSVDSLQISEKTASGRGALDTDPHRWRDRRRNINARRNPYGAPEWSAGIVAGGQARHQ